MVSGDVFCFLSLGICRDSAPGEDISLLLVVLLERKIKKNYECVQKLKITQAKELC